MPAPYTTIECANEGSLAWIRLNRPSVHNAINTTCLQELAGALDAAGRDDAVRAIAIIGKGGRAFTAGADIAEMKDKTSAEMMAYNRLWLDLLAAIEAIGKPVIAAVHGFAMGGGTELSLACDVVIATTDARFGLAEINIGVIPGAGAALRLTRWLGRLKAKEILMFGRLIPGEDAVALHLANECVAPSALEERVRALAAELAAKPPLALAAAKASVNAAGEMTQADGMEYELYRFLQLFETEDQKEGMRAFLEKRKPQFRGR
ncbi:MAG: enoyl-CoA hydratase/isomerase family protein [Alphaproteobacteria bacterium]